MSVTVADIVFYAASSMPENNTTLSGGAIDTTTKIIFTDIAATDKVAISSSNAGDTTQTVTVYGRDSTGVITSDAISLNGTTRVAGTVNFERILKIVCNASHNGTITITRNDNPTYTAIGTMESGILKVRRLFYDASADASGGSSRDYYEKVFVKNTNSTTALSNCQVKEQSDPTGKVTFDLESSKSGSNSATNRLTAPVTGMLSSFDNSDKYAVGSSLGPAEVQGIWLKLTLAAGSSPTKSTWTVRLAGTTT